MRRIIVGAIIALFAFTSGQAQTFTNTTGGLIPDNNTEVCFPVIVSGLPIVMDTTFGVLRCCINITHTYTGDLKIKLKSPTGIVVMLSSNNGGGGNDYAGTCFRMDSVISPIGQGTAPFIGNYLPDQSINDFNTGADPNGTWQLCIIDEVPADIGTLDSFSIVFGNNPPPNPPGPVGPCTTSNGTGCLCPDGTQNCDLLPDMTASALIIQNEHTEHVGYMTLSNATPNIGWGPMEIWGTNACACDTTVVPCTTTLCPNGQAPKQLINQRVYHKNGSAISYYDRPAGTMSYHPSHSHTHVDNWAHFSLRIPTSNPDARTWPIIGTGSKVSFCLINLGNCTSDYGYCLDSIGNIITMADIPNSPMGSVSGCGVSQGIYVGNLDIYGQGLPGMQINFPGVCNGQYYIVSITDPDDNFLESNENNNWVAVPVTLTQQPGAPINSAFTYSSFANSFVFAPDTTGTLTYLWDFGDGFTSNMDTAYHVYNQPGVYNVTLQVSNGSCSSLSAQTVHVFSTQISEQLPSGIKEIKCFPNPFNDKATISFSLDNKAMVKVEVYNSMGQKITTLTDHMLNPGTHEFLFDGGSGKIQSGVYYVRVFTADRAETVRLISIY